MVPVPVKLWLELASKKIKGIASSKTKITECVAVRGARKNRQSNWLNS